MEKEYEIKIIERDPNEKYVIARINKEEVKIEKLSDEEIKEWENLINKNKYEMIIEEIKKIKLDSEFVFHYTSDACVRMSFYFGDRRYFFELGDFPYFGYFLKYKKNYFFVEMDEERVPVIHWILLVPMSIYEKYHYGKDEEAKKIREEYTPPKDICEEFIAIIENIMFPKYKIEVISHDRAKGYVIVKINGEEVKIEKVVDEEMKELNKLMREKGYYLMELGLVGGEILFKEKEIRKEKPLAIYRLLLYFGIPNSLRETSSCVYYLKYKGQIFSVFDRIFGHIEICLDYWIPKDIYEKYYYGKNEEARKIREEYAPPKDICEEFIAIIKYLVRNPCTVYTLQYGYVSF
jgi:hypothetical protein